MSAYDTTTQEGTDAELTDFDGRPDDCDCWDADAEHAAERNTLMDHEPEDLVGEPVDDVDADRRARLFPAS